MSVIISRIIKLEGLRKWRDGRFVEAKLPPRRPAETMISMPFLAGPKGIVSPIAYTERVSEISNDHLVEKALTLSYAGHAGQFRKDGNPYIDHPVSVAKIIREWGVGPDEIAAALCHDLIEDGTIDGQRITGDFLKAQLGARIGRLVEGVTERGKEPEFSGKKPTEDEIYRKLLELASSDPGIFIIKLADRLHNMRTLVYKDPKSRINKAIDTLYFYVRIADILGIWSVKHELEDLAFSYLEEDKDFNYKYSEVFAKREEIAGQTEAEIQRIVEALKSHLSGVSSDFEVKIEKRFIYEIYERMLRRGVLLSELSASDIWRINVITSTRSDCYSFLGEIQEAYPPVQGETLNFIAVPRPNGHQFLQTYVEVPGFGRLLIHVRDEKMYANYQMGVISTLGSQDLAWQKTLLGYLRSDAALKKESGKDLYKLVARASLPITVYSRTGNKLQMPYGSTALDFARRINEGIFLKANTAIINGRPAKLFQELADGDSVFVETDEGARPQLEWIDFIRTPEAIKSLQDHLGKNTDRAAFDAALDYLDKKTVKYCLPIRALIKERYFASFIEENFGTLMQLLLDIGRGTRTDADDIIHEFIIKYWAELNRLAGSAERSHVLVEAEDRPGLLNDMTGYLKNFSINLAQALIYVYRVKERKMAKLLLTFEQAPGSIGAIQQLQADTVIHQARGIEKVRYLDPDQASNSYKLFVKKGAF